MKGNTHERNLDALNAGIAKSRGEIAALSSGLKELADWKIDRSPVGGERSDDGSANGGWTGFRRRLDEAGARGKRVTKGLAHEIERHPLIGGMVAFGCGFAIATLLFRRSRKDSRQ